MEVTYGTSPLGPLDRIIQLMLLATIAVVKACNRVVRDFYCFRFQSKTPRSGLYSTPTVPRRTFYSSLSAMWFGAQGVSKKAKSAL